MIFAAMSIYGYITRRNLTGIGTLAMFGLIGIIIASLINMFVGNGMVDTIIAGIGVIIFIVLTAYDTQKIKMMSLGHTA
jgi:FtsH-binding integral membrane protein